MEVDDVVDLGLPGACEAAPLDLPAIDHRTLPVARSIWAMFSASLAPAIASSTHQDVRRCGCAGPFFEPSASGACHRRAAAIVPVARSWARYTGLAERPFPVEDPQSEIDDQPVEPNRLRLDDGGSDDGVAHLRMGQGLDRDAIDRDFRNGLAVLILAHGDVAAVQRRQLAIRQRAYRRLVDRRDADVDAGLRQVRRYEGAANSGRQRPRSASST